LLRGGCPDLRHSLPDSKHRPESRHFSSTPTTNPTLHMTSDGYIMHLSNTSTARMSKSGAQLYREAWSQTCHQYVYGKCSLKKKALKERCKNSSSEILAQLKRTRRRQYKTFPQYGPAAGTRVLPTRLLSLLGKLFPLHTRRNQLRSKLPLKPILHRYHLAKT
jgi:hypothetical protein